MSARDAAETHVNAIYMKWGRHSGPRGYHHGNLKEALVRAALESDRREGSGRLHLRRRRALGGRFARRRLTGISATATNCCRTWRGAASSSSPRRRRSAWDDGKPDVFTAFDRLGKAYLHFAKREPAYYSAMFEAGVPLDADPQLREAGERAFAVLRGAAEKLVALMPAKGRPPALMVALHIWSLTHGIASLFSRGDAARRALPMPPEELLEAAFLIYLRGLGLPGRAPPRRAAERPMPLRNGARASYVKGLDIRPPRPYSCKCYLHSHARLSHAYHREAR